LPCFSITPKPVVRRPGSMSRIIMNECYTAGQDLAWFFARRILLSMTEMARAGVQHHHAALVGGVDHFLVAHRSARLDHAGRAGVDHHVEPVAEREEGIRRD